MTKIAIIEDDNLTNKEIQSYVEKFFNEKQKEFLIKTFDNAEAFINSYKPDYNLILVDINLPGIDGMNAIKEIRKNDSSVMVIFITSLAQYAIKGYEVGAFDFLVKPINYYSFSLKLNRAYQNLNNSLNSTIILNNKSSMKKIEISSILYIETNDHKLIFHTLDGLFETYGSMKSYVDILSKYPFELCNQCYYVNLKYVTEVIDNYVKVGNEKLLISRPRRPDFIKALNLYFSKGGGNVL